MSATTIKFIASSGQFLCVTLLAKHVCVCVALLACSLLSTFHQRCRTANSSSHAPSLRQWHSRKPFPNINVTCWGILAVVASEYIICPSLARVLILAPRKCVIASADLMLCAFYSPTFSRASISKTRIQSLRAPSWTHGSAERLFFCVCCSCAPNRTNQNIPE